MNHISRIERLERRLGPIESVSIRIERIGPFELVYYGNLIVKILKGVSLEDI